MRKCTYMKRNAFGDSVLCDLNAIVFHDSVLCDLNAIAFHDCEDNITRA